MHFVACQNVLNSFIVTSRNQIRKSGAAEHMETNEEENKSAHFNSLMCIYLSYPNSC